MGVMEIVNGFFANAVSGLMKWLWSLKASTKTAISGRPMMKFEGGYTVETVFDGSKLGIEPYSVEVLPNGELLVLDSANSNLYKMSSPLSLYSRPRLIAGSADGYAGHVDGRYREARMNHPKGLTVDDRGNIYIADTVNMAIRKISDAAYKRTNRRAIFLDYNGTHIPQSSIVKTPSPELINILSTLCNDPKNTVFIISGRGRDSLSEWLAALLPVSGLD